MIKKGDDITVKIGRFGSDTSTVSIPENTSVGDALEEAGISVGSNEKIWVNGEKATSRDILEDGDVVNVVSPKEAGI